jgi:C1A family cysteine protease
MFLVRNSWGTAWGQGGYGTISYDYVTNNALAGDFWTVRSVKERPVKPVDA